MVFFRRWIKWSGLWGQACSGAGCKNGQWRTMGTSCVHYRNGHLDFGATVTGSTIKARFYCTNSPRYKPDCVAANTLIAWWNQCCLQNAPGLQFLKTLVCIFHQVWHPDWCLHSGCVPTLTNRRTKMLPDTQWWRGTAATNLIVFLPLVLCERLVPSSWHTGTGPPSFYLPFRAEHGTSAVVAMTDTPWAASSANCELMNRRRQHTITDRSHTCKTGKDFHRAVRHGESWKTKMSHVVLTGPNLKPERLHRKIGMWIKF